MKEEIRQKLTGAVIGLARTCENNEKTENTNRVFLEALTVAGDWSASIFDMSEMLEKVRNEKYTVSPGCVTCAAPCGNTDDYDMENLWKESEEIGAFKNTILMVICQTAAKLYHADQIEESGFAIRYQCEATHTRFIGDSSRMYRVVQNVIENALKYSLKGTRIFLRITEADQNIKLEVINTASYEMNFTEEEIMERFARAEKSRTSEGNGLGLSIADSFTKNCGGEFSIRIDGDQFLVTIQFKQHLDVNK